MGATILVLDDRDADRNLLAVVLGHAGHQVLEAESGERALELARSERPDLVISDILMPGMNGYEFARRLREDPGLADTLIVFSTATYDQDEVRQLAEACGVRHFLPKPSDPKTILSTVSTALGAPNGEAIPESADPDFNLDREQLRIVNDKLVEKVGELERATTERQQLIAELIQTQESERSRIAQALHDDPIQVLAAVALRLAALAEQVGEESQELLEAIRVEVSNAIDRMRELVFDLEPLTLRTHGLEAALRAYLDRARAEGLDCELEVSLDGEPEGLTRTLLYRIATEAVANVRKHAEASLVSVNLSRREASWLLRVNDDGRGFDPASEIRVRPGHLGLAAIRERLQMAGGSLLVESSVGEGTTVEVQVPAIEAPPG